MFCRNCKGQINLGAPFCTLCGVPTGAGKNYCQFCGESVDPLAVFCVKCGASLVPMNQQGTVGTKSKLSAGLLGIFLGSFGVHNFYLGYIKKAVLQLVISLIATAGYMVIIFAQMFSQFPNMMNNSTTYGDYNSYSMLPTYHLGITSGSIIFMLLFLLIMMGIRVWTIIEAIFILTGKINKDAKGNLLKD